MRFQEKRFAGQVAIVTGGSSGIGLAVATALFEAGAYLAVVGRSSDRIEAALNSIDGSGNHERLLGLALDVRSAEDMTLLAERVLSQWSRIDILVAAAGSIGEAAMERGMPYGLIQLPTSDWDDVIDTNLKGVIHSNRAVLPAMIAQGRGEIVNVSSARGARGGLPYSGAYCASKHGLAAFTNSLADEVAPQGVRVQSILPDVTDTPMMTARESVAPAGLLAAHQVAELILELVGAPDDMQLLEPLLLPFGMAARSPASSNDVQDMASEDERDGLPLSGKAAIVTGGGSGIGRATCVKLHELGANVTVVDLHEEAAAATAALLEETRGRTTASLGADVRREEDMQRMSRVVLERLGRIDILVHSAAILRGKNSGPKVMADVSVEEMNDVIDTNLKGVFLCNRAVLPAMFAQRSGQIVNISSTSGRKGRALDSVYCASKFGVVGLTESLAEEVRRQGVKVQLVMPDAVATPLWNQNGPIPAPEDSLPPERIADLIGYMVTLPADAMLENVVISPFRTRRPRAPRGTVELKPSVAEDQA